MINSVVSTQNISNKNPIKMNISSRILERITITRLQSFVLSHIKNGIVTYHNVRNVFSSTKPSIFVRHMMFLSLFDVAESRSGFLDLYDKGQIIKTVSYDEGTYIRTE